MGAVEFRRHMEQFEEVSEPEFGDIVRYYVDEPIYSGGMIFNGEIHAAVYIGKEMYLDRGGKEWVREIVLTKNGRTDLDFLIFQDVRQLDEYYLSDADGHKKGFFRVRRGASLLDPEKSRQRSAAHNAYLVDIKNYLDRWMCLEGVVHLPDGADCYS